MHPRQARVLCLAVFWAVLLTIVLVRIAHARPMDVADAPSALAERAEMPLRVSPRERYFVWILLREEKFKGSDQDFAARVWESLALDATARAVDKASREAKGDPGARAVAIELSFSDKAEARKIARDDAGALAKRLGEMDLSGGMVIALRPLRVALIKIADGRDPYGGTK